MLPMNCKKRNFGERKESETRNSTFIRGIQKLDREIFHDLLHKNENYLFIQEVYKKNKFFKEMQGLILDSIFILIKLIRV